MVPAQPDFDPRKSRKKSSRLQNVFGFLLALPPTEKEVPQKEITNLPADAQRLQGNKSEAQRRFNHSLWLVYLQYVETGHPHSTGDTRSPRKESPPLEPPSDSESSLGVWEPVALAGAELAGVVSALLSAAWIFELGSVRCLPFKSVATRPDVTYHLLGTSRFYIFCNAFLCPIPFCGTRKCFH